MKIGMILDKKFPQDARVENEAKMLLSANYNVSILCYHSDSFNEKQYHNINLIQISQKRKWIASGRALIGTIFDYYSTWWSKQIRQFIANEHIDVLHVHDLYMAIAAIKATRKRKKKLPIILDLHENYPAAIMSYQWATSFPNKFIVSPGLWQKREKKILQNIDGLVVLSDYFKRYIVKKYPFIIPENIIVYPNLPNLNEFIKYPIQKDIIDTKNRFTLFYFGVLAERRGIFIILEALRKFRIRIPEVLLLLIGPVDKSDQKRFEDYFNDPVLNSHIIHYNWKDISLLESYVNSCDICLSPILKNDQHEAGVANKIFQYMLFGKPLLVSDCIPQEEIVLNYHCGLSYRNTDEEDFIEKLMILYNDAELRHLMGENGKKAVIEKFNVENYSQIYINDYQRLLESYNYVR